MKKSGLQEKGKWFTVFNVTLLKERKSKVQKTWRLCIFLVSCARDEIPSSDLKSCLGLSFSFSNVRWLLSFSITSLFRLCPHPLIQDIFGTYSCTFFVLFQAKRSIPTCPLLLGIFSWQNCPLIKFVGQHGDSCLGHKLSNTLKNSEWQACRVATILGQCDPSSPVPCSLTYSPKTFNLSANKGQLPAEAPK